MKFLLTLTRTPPELTAVAAMVTLPTDHYHFDRVRMAVLEASRALDSARSARQILRAEVTTCPKKTDPRLVYFGYTKPDGGMVEFVGADLVPKECLGEPAV